MLIPHVSYPWAMSVTRMAALIATLTLLAGCGSINPFVHAETPEDKALVTLRSYDIIQEEVEPFVANTSLPANARQALQEMDRFAVAGLTELAGAFKEVQAARTALAEAYPPDAPEDEKAKREARLRVANANLIQWTATARARIQSVRDTLKRLKEDSNP
jgi:hypothetical protein